MKVKKITKKAAELENEVKTRMFTAIAAAFALVIALTWNEAIKSIVLKIVESLGLIGEGYLFQIMAAVITTIICVIGLIYASKLSGIKK